MQAEYEAKAAQLARKKKFMADNNGKFADYFLRYSATVPPDEISDYQKFIRDCPCKQAVTFDDSNGWHDLVHQSLKNSEENL